MTRNPVRAGSGRLLLRLVVGALVVVALLTAVAFGALSLAYSPTYVARWAVWQDADVDDFERFPARTVASAAEPFVFDQPDDAAATTDAVRAAMAAAVGEDAETFLEEAGTQAFIVIEDDVVLFERYFGGFARGSTATSFSVAKSYLSALVGIAINEGAIRSADDPITDYLPELLERDQRFAAITVRHLLDMTSGIRYEESGFVTGDDPLTYYFDDLRALALENTRIEEPPGRRWHYNNYNPLLLGMILERTTGMAVATYLEQRLWSRIGTEAGASWSLDREDGLEKLESGINARAIDFAKLGRLYLHGGSWDGQQVVPADWVEDSTRPTDAGSGAVYPPALDQPFGTIRHERYWWRVEGDTGATAFSALGNHGQYVFVAPDARLIVVRFGREYGVQSFEWLRIFSALAADL